ncbi:MAG: hypothetical protein ABIP67_14310 [Burkholderiales bacterium]
MAKIVCRISYSFFLLWLYLYGKRAEFGETHGSNGLAGGEAGVKKHLAAAGVCPLVKAHGDIRAKCHSA